MPCSRNICNIYIYIYRDLIFTFTDAPRWDCLLCTIGRYPLFVCACIVPNFRPPCWTNVWSPKWMSILFCQSSQPKRARLFLGHRKEWSSRVPLQKQSNVLRVQLNYLVSSVVVMVRCPKGPVSKQMKCPEECSKAGPQQLVFLVFIWPRTAEPKQIQSDMHSFRKPKGVN